MKHIKKLLSILLALTMVFIYYLAVPANVMAKEARQSQSVGQYAADTRTTLNYPVEYSRLLGEDESKRGANEKHFFREDHSVEAVSYAFDVHYSDDGQWKAIDNTLTPVTLADGSVVYKNTANDFQVTFASSVNDEKLVTISKDGYVLSWSMDGASSFKAAATAQVANVATDETMSAMTDEEQDDRLRFPPELTSQIQYIDAESNAQISYVLYGKSLSEYINVIEKPTKKISYTIEMECDGLYPITNRDDGVIVFANEEGEPVFNMSQPVMFDANGSQSDDITVALDETTVRNDSSKSDTPTTYVYAIEPSMDWLQSDECVYPVVIDPDITTP